MLPAESTAPDSDEGGHGHPTSLLRRLRVSAKLALAFGALLALAATTAVVAFVGLRKVEHTWQQALHLGADLAQRTEKARASLQAARRHEKEFLLRWPDAGVALAFRTWIKPSTTGAGAGLAPPDAHGTVDADIAEFRASLQWIGKALSRAAAAWRPTCCAAGWRAGMGLCRTKMQVDPKPAIGCARAWVDGLWSLRTVLR